MVLYRLQTSPRNNYKDNKMHMILLFFTYLFISTISSTPNYVFIPDGRSLTIICPMLSGFYNTSAYKTRPDLVLVLPSQTDSSVTEEKVHLFKVNVKDNEYKTCPDEGNQEICLSVANRFEEPRFIEGGDPKGRKDKILFRLKVEFKDGGSKFECSSFNKHAYTPPKTNERGFSWPYKVYT